MPNPSILHTVLENRFGIARGWRVVMRFEKGDGYRAWLEHLRDGQWEACGPSALSRRSEPCALQRLADAYRSFGAAIEQRLALAPGARIDAGCPKCGYTHITFRPKDDAITWHCAACGRSGCRPAFDPV